MCLICNTSSSWAEISRTVAGRWIPPTICRAKICLRGSNWGGMIRCCARIASSIACTHKFAWRRSWSCCSIEGGSRGAGRWGSGMLRNTSSCSRTAARIARLILLFRLRVIRSKDKSTTSPKIWPINDQEPSCTSQLLVIRVYSSPRVPRGKCFVHRVVSCAAM